MKVTQSTVASGEATSITRRRRSNELADIRKRLSLDDEEKQITDEMKILPDEMRKELVKDINFNITIPADESLAMKADLCLSWRKLRIMRRYVTLIFLNNNNNNILLDGLCHGI